MLNFSFANFVNILEFYPLNMFTFTFIYFNYELI